MAYATPAHFLSLESSFAHRPTPFRALITMHHLAAERPAATHQVETKRSPMKRCWRRGTGPAH